MKKVMIGLATLIAVIITAVTFNACNKEKETSISEIVNQSASDPALDIKMESEKDGFDLEKRVEILSQETGIDIRKIGQLSGIQELARQNQKTMNAIEKMINSTQKGSLDDEIHDLVNKIQTEYNAGNYEMVLQLYEKLCARCATISGFVFDVNEYGLQTATYINPENPKSPLYLNLPFTQMSINQKVLTQIVDNNPKFPKLPQHIQEEMVSYAILLNYKEKESLSKEQSHSNVNSCIADARWQLAGTLAGLTGLCVAGTALCGGTAFAILACEAVVWAGYYSSVIAAKNQFGDRKRLCELQGYF